MTETKVTFHEPVEPSTEEVLLQQILASLNQLNQLLRAKINQDEQANAEWKDWRERVTSYSQYWGTRLKVKPVDG